MFLLLPQECYESEGKEGIILKKGYEIRETLLFTFPWLIKRKGKGGFLNASLILYCRCGSVSTVMHTAYQGLPL